MASVTTSEFHLNPAQVAALASEAPVELTGPDGERVGWLVSDEAAGLLRKLQSLAGRAHFAHEMEPELVEALDQMRMDPRFDYLDSLLDS